jgi:hypothetical protein
MLLDRRSNHMDLVILKSPVFHISCIVIMSVYLMLTMYEGHLTG